MGAILELGDRFGLPVLEDATECLGAKYGERPAGSLGLMGCFSINGKKILTAGGGGMLVTNDDKLAQRARYLTTQAKDDPLEFVHGEVGYNYRLPNVLAAIGCAQLDQLDKFVARKREIAAVYTDALVGLPGVAPMREPPGTFSSFWLYTTCIDESKAKLGSRDLMKALDAEGIQTRPVWQPMDLSPAHQGAYATDCSVAERLNRQGLSLPCSVGLSIREQQAVIALVTEAIASRAP